jgi:hypothetical protein
MDNKYMRKCSTSLAPKDVKSNKIAGQDAGHRELLCPVSNE